jgi:hypothetical protein
MHSNFNDLKTTKMEAKEWFEKSEYQYALDEYDEGGYLGIDENKVCQMLEEYHQDKLKLLGIGDVVGSLRTWASNCLDNTTKLRQGDLESKYYSGQELAFRMTVDEIDKYIEQ